MCGCAGDWADVALNYEIVFKGNFDPAKDRVQYISENGQRIESVKPDRVIEIE